MAPAPAAAAEVADPFPAQRFERDQVEVLGELALVFGEDLRELPPLGAEGGLDVRRVVAGGNRIRGRAQPPAEGVRILVLVQQDDHAVEHRIDPLTDLQPGLDQLHVRSSEEVLEGVQAPGVGVRREGSQGSRSV